MCGEFVFGFVYDVVVVLVCIVGVVVDQDFFFCGDGDVVCIDFYVQFGEYVDVVFQCLDVDVGGGGYELDVFFECGDVYCLLCVDQYVFVCVDVCVGVVC